MLTHAGTLRKRGRKTRELATAENLLEKEAEDKEDKAEQDAFAEAEYGVYQGHLANMLMMSTLLFGFCGTGTFLSVSFTGDEVFSDTRELVDLIKNALRSTCASVLVTIAAFVFSARAAWQYQLFGAREALKPIYRGMLFIVAAELCLYYSLMYFVLSIKNYANMNYMGPDICPTTRLFTDLLEPADRRLPLVWGEGAEAGSRFLMSNRSFCSRVGESMYDAATALCPASVLESDEELDITCAMYQGYNYEYDSHGPYRFGWDAETNWGGIIDFPWEYWTQEAFLEVVAKTSDHMCAMENATASVAAFCHSAVGTVSAECVQARILQLQADACTGGKEDDAVKCRKSCQRVWDNVNGGSNYTSYSYTSTRSIIERSLEESVNYINVGLMAVLLCRGIAGVVITYKSLRRLCTDSGLCGVLWAIDVFGIFDAFQSSDGDKAGDVSEGDEEE